MWGFRFALVAIMVAGCSATDQGASSADALPTPLDESGEGAAAMTDGEVHETCKVVSELAAMIMDARQSGVPMARMMETSVGGADVEFERFNRSLVVEAFRRPRMSVEENRRDEVRDFENQAYLRCTLAAAADEAG